MSVSKGDIKGTGKEGKADIVKKYGLTLVALWTLNAAVALGYTIYLHHQSILNEAKTEARTYYDMNLAYRLWIAKAGGVYAASDKIAPNPYLNVPDRDVTTTDHKHLTLVNPAYMSRMVFEIVYTRSSSPVINRITSEKCFNPSNKPSEWERKALRSFERGAEEAVEVTDVENKPYLRLMMPFITEKSCLKCHGGQGYKVGDVRGGMSVSIPLQPYYAEEVKSVARMSGTYFLLWLSVSIGLVTFSKKRYLQEQQLIAAGEKLRQSEYLSKTIIETEPECVKMLDAEGNLIFMNRAGLDMIQAETLEQVRGRCVYPLIMPDFRDAFIKLTKDACNGSSGSLTFEMTGLKGENKWLETHAVPFRTDGNDIVGLLSVTRDVTEKIETERALKQSEQNFRTLFNKSADAIILLKADGTIADVNDAACERYRYRRDELLNMHVRQITSSATSEGVAERMNRIKEQGTAIYEVEHVTRDGALIPVEVSACFITMGNEPLYLCTCRDISERKKAQDAIAAEKERLAVTLRSIGDGVIVMDVEGRITMLNRVAEQLTGWANEDAAGKELTEVFNLIDMRTREKYKNPVGGALQGAAVSLRGQIMLIRKDGSEIMIADSAAPIKDRQSRTIGVVVVFRDITAQHHMEKEMQKMQKLESLGLLAGGLAHDFNNLLTSIIGNVSLAKMQVGPEHKSLNRLADAEKAAKRAADLTHQLLTFAKGGAPIKRPASIADIVRETCHFAMSGSNVKCLYEIPSGLWNVEVDKGQMSQVFNNLIINSIYAMPAGGAVHVAFENKEVREPESLSLKPGEYVKITFRDEGTGIPEENMARIFEPYFTTKPGGTGLGLATVLSIINRHEGHISVESKAGTGTTFTIYIPAIREGVPPVAEGISGVQSGRGRILVMDDEELIRNVAGSILTELGYDVAFARDGKEAIEVYLNAEQEKNPFSVVIMDLTIPGGVGGKEALKDLLAVAPDAKVIVSSGYSMDPIMADYKKYGFCGVVCKPYNAEQIGEAIARACKE